MSFAGFGIAPGTWLAASTVYAPPVKGTFTTTSATFAAISTGNITTPSYTAPPSGRVLVQISMVWQESAANNVAFALSQAVGSIVVMPGSNVIQPAAANATSGPATVLEIPVSGLAAGQQYQHDVLFAALAGTLNVFAIGQTANPAVAGNIGGPVVVKVLAD